MKTSIHVPQDLYDHVTSLDTEVTFAELMRDALTIALPQWQRELKDGSVAFRLRMRVRAAENAAALAGRAPVYRGGRKAADRRRAAPPAPEPASRPRRHPADGKRSVTTPAARIAHPLPPGKTRRSSRPK